MQIRKTSILEMVENCQTYLGCELPISVLL